eukprot:5012165-Amphidinium_carterae.1
MFALRSGVAALLVTAAMVYCSFSLVVVSSYWPYGCEHCSDVSFVTGYLRAAQLISTEAQRSQARQRHQSHPAPQVQLESSRGST